jgi:hypothetical protein
MCSIYRNNQLFVYFHSLFLSIYTYWDDKESQSEHLVDRVNANLFLKPYYSMSFEANIHSEELFIHYWVSSIKYFPSII